VIGDSLSDMAAATRLGCRKIWIGHDAASIDDAADLLLGERVEILAR
jgi:FMN phosphatase YigB (HAD superfamily)